MATIASLMVALRANTSVFDRAMKRSGNKLKRFSSLAATAMKFVGAASGLVAAGGLVVMTKRTMASIDATAKLSDRLGIATEDLIGLRHAAELTGAGSAAMDKALEMMNRRLGEAKAGTGEAARGLETLDLAADQLIAKNPSQSFKLIADGISKLPTQADKATAAYQIFGRQGSLLLNTLEQGSQGISDMAAEAERLGLTFSRFDAAKVEQANDAFTRMRAVGAGLIQTLTIELAPAIEVMATKFTEAGAAGGGMGSAIISGMRGAAKGMAKVADMGVYLKIGWLQLRQGSQRLWAGMIDGIASVVGHFEWLTNLLASTWIGQKLGIQEVDWTSDLRDTAEGLRMVADEMEKEMLDMAMQPLPSEQVDAYFDDVEKKAKVAEKAMKDATDARVKMAQSASALDAYTKTAEEIDKVNAKLREQVDLYGLSQREQQLQKLQQSGSNVPAEYQQAYNEKLAETISLMDQLEQKEAAAKAAEETRKKMDDLAQEGQRIFDATRTPLEKYEQQIGKLGKLLDANAIDWDTYSRAVRQAREQLDGVANMPSVATNLGDFSTINTSQVDVQGLSIGAMSDPVVNKLDEQLQEQREQKQLLRRMADNEGLQ